jgi:hypothetical protein
MGGLGSIQCTCMLLYWVLWLLAMLVQSSKGCSREGFLYVPWLGLQPKHGTHAQQRSAHLCWWGFMTWQASSH